MVYGTDFKSSDDEECLPETTATIVHPISSPTPALVIAAPLPMTTTTTPTTSAPLALEEHLTHLEEG